MKIAVDAMGGDFAPVEVVKGAVEASRKYNVTVVLVGPENRVRAELARMDISGSMVEVVHTDQWLVEGEHPALALRSKRNASIFVAARLVKEGKADAVVGFGPTGGVVAAAMQIIGTVEGVSRPVVGGAFLGFAPSLVMMDLGGNVDCRPDQLLDFAVVGTVFARKFFKVENPAVAILSNGAEEGKGNELVRETWPLLKKSGLNFIGAAEGNDILSGKANVIVCDGFVGNVLVKFCEALGKTAGKYVEEKISGRLPEGEVRDIVDGLYRATNAAEVLGAGPFWAVNGVVIKGHGRSRAPEIARGIGQARLTVELDIPGALREELARVKQAVRSSSL